MSQRQRPNSSFWTANNRRHDPFLLECHLHQSVKIEREYNLDVTRGNHVSDSTMCRGGYFQALLPLFFGGLKIGSEQLCALWPFLSKFSNDLRVVGLSTFICGSVPRSRVWVGI